MAGLFELSRSINQWIYAVPYRNGRRPPAVRLPDGAIVEAPLPDDRINAPVDVAGLFEIGQGGVPATLHDANLGLISAILPLSGIFLLPEGDVAAV